MICEDEDTIEIKQQENPANTNSSLSEQLEGFIRESAQCSSTCFKNNDFQLGKNEMNLFEGSGKLTDNLQKLQSALSTMQPTSTQNERNFSIFAHFVSKRRTRLSDKSIDGLCVLKSHFKSIYLILSSTFFNIYFFNNK